MPSLSAKTELTDILVAVLVGLSQLYVLQTHD